MVCSWRLSRRAVSGTVSKRGERRTDGGRIGVSGGKMGATLNDGQSAAVFDAKVRER